MANLKGHLQEILSLSPYTQLVPENLVPTCHIEDINQARQAQEIRLT